MDFKFVRTSDEELIDKRTKGEDLILLIFIVHRDAVSKYEKRETVVKKIEKILAKLNTVDDLSIVVLKEIRAELDHLF
jgi:hypothetical protein